MIEEQEYIETIETFFSFLIDEFGYVKSSVKIRGNAFYDVQYSNDIRSISISYENIGDYFQVIVYTLRNGEMPNYDDDENILYLKDHNRSIWETMSKESVKVIAEKFAQYHTYNPFKRAVLKQAKDLYAYLMNVEIRIGH
ncbi:MAG: hypothetical protein LBN29_03320 [Mediterranea sp.]|jgi:hypothetical protein|nr:hypothetical protein [Mediterranea sp.]